MSFTLAIRRLPWRPARYPVKVPPQQLAFGPNRAPVWLAGFSGLVACLCAGLFLMLATYESSGQGAGTAAFLGIAAVVAGAFGVWMLVNAWRISKLRATLTPEALHLVAHGGRRIWLQRALAEATIPWAEVQGFSHVGILNPAAKGGTQTTYILYTRQGDFTLNDIQWNNLAGLIDEISRRTARPSGEVAPERTVALDQVHAGERRMFWVLRVLGWILAGMCAILLLPLIVDAFSSGISGDIARAAIFLAIAITLAGSMIRYYRRRP